MVYEPTSAPREGPTGWRGVDDFKRNRPADGSLGYASAMRQFVTVTSAGATFQVEVDEEVVEGDGGFGPVSLDDHFNLEGVKATVRAIATEFAEVWEQVRPDEATLEFGLKLSAKSGKLTSLVVEGAGEAALSVSLTWKASS